MPIYMTSDEMHTVNRLAALCEEPEYRSGRLQPVDWICWHDLH